MAAACFVGFFVGFFLQEPDSDTRKWLCFNQFFFFKSTGDLFDFERRMNVNRQSLPLSPSGQSKVQHLKRNAETYVFFSYRFHPNFTSKCPIFPYRNIFFFVRVIVQAVNSEERHDINTIENGKKKKNVVTNELEFLKMERQGENVIFDLYGEQ